MRMAEDILKKFVGEMVKELKEGLESLMVEDCVPVGEIGEPVVEFLKQQGYAIPGQYDPRDGDTLRLTDKGIKLYQELKNSLED